jgi:hypothetical protein
LTARKLAVFLFVFGSSRSYNTVCFSVLLQINFSLGEEMEHPWYDTVVGIADSIWSIAALNRLEGARRQAGVRGEDLNYFLIRGRWLADKSGGFGRIWGNIPAEIFPDLLPVMTFNEFQELLKTNHLGWVSLGLGVGEYSCLPKIESKCAWCGDSWSAEDCHDVVTEIPGDMRVLT